tara:strand:+ start:127 stop:492 length:366 start_codon:yes stop_codon:yes gene_type:complete
MLRFMQFVENYDELNEREWTPAQRRRAKVSMKKNKAKLRIGMKRLKFKIADKARIDRRAQRQGRKDMGKKLTKGRAKSELSAAQKSSLEKRLSRISNRIKNLGRRIRKDKRKQELQRKRGK